MSLDIDMKNFAGVKDPDAEGQYASNSYMQEGEDFLVNKELLDNPEDAFVGHEETAQPPIEVKQQINEPSPQELNFKALREEVDRIKQEREYEKREHQLQLEMLRVNQTRQPPQEEHKMFKDLADDDIPNVRDLRQEWEQRENTYKSRLQELEFQSRNPDYAEVLNKYLTPLVKEKPFLAREIENSSNPSALAYEMAKLAQAREAREQIKPEPASPSNYAQKIVDNARKPGTLSQAGGQNTLSKADYFATMSDQEFYKLASKNLEGI
jgi:hypothetical protein